MKLIILTLTLLALTGCGKIDRLFAAWTGDATETCHKGVKYLQFTSGATVMYKQDGTIAKCEE